MEKQVIEAWLKYGINIEIDSAGYYSWCETNSNGEVDGPSSPSFSNLENCVSDLEFYFGPLEEKGN